MESFFWCHWTERIIGVTQFRRLNFRPSAILETQSDSFHFEIHMLSRSFEIHIVSLKDNGHCWFVTLCIPSSVLCASLWIDLPVPRTAAVTLSGQTDQSKRLYQSQCGAYFHSHGECRLHRLPCVCVNVKYTGLKLLQACVNCANYAMLHK